MPVASSRSFARAIRARQELTKRFAAMLPSPQWKGGASLAPFLSGDARRAIGARESAGGDLQAWLSSASARRFPSSHLNERAPSALPAADELLADVARLERGDWLIFGAPVNVEPKSIDWTANPVTGIAFKNARWSRLRVPFGSVSGDVKHIWELNRHAELVRLAQGYKLTGRGALAERVVGLLSVWMEQNPPECGINWASSLELAYRAIAWCWVWHLTREAPAWNSDVLPRFLWHLWHHARHIERYDSIHHSPNTHLTGEALGLLYVGLLFPEFRRSSRWAAIGAQLLVTELEHQMLSDGMHFERAVGYHRHTLGIFLHAALLAREFALPASSKLEAALGKMLGVSYALERPDGTWPIIGDEDSGSVLHLTTSHMHDQRPLLAPGAALLREAKWAAGLDDRARAAGWWLLPRADWEYLESIGSAALTPSARHFPNAGYCVVREAGPSGWYCLVDGGPHGGGRTGHAHTDLGHVEIAHGAIAIVADPGSSTYTGDLEVRDRERSEAAHACLVLPETPLAMPRGAFSWRTTSPSPELQCDCVSGLWQCIVRYGRRSSAGDLRHLRQVVLVPECGVVVCDHIEGSLSEPAALYWPLPHDIRSLTARDDGVDGLGFAIAFSSTGGKGRVRPAVQQAHFSPSYGETRPGGRLRLEFGPPTPIVIATAFTSVPARVSICGITSDDVTIEITSRGQRLHVIVSRTRPPSFTVVAASNETNDNVIR